MANHFKNYQAQVRRTKNNEISAEDLEKFSNTVYGGYMKTIKIESSFLVGDIVYSIVVDIDSEFSFLELERD